MEVQRNNSLSIQKRLYEELKDPSSLGLYEEPVILVPCGHTSGESTLDKARKLCHICRAPFTQTVKNPTIKNLVEIVADMPEVEEVKEVEETDHTEEAEKLFDKVKGLVENKKYDEAVQSLAQVLVISPNYKEAIGYNSCLLTIIRPKPIDLVVAPAPQRVLPVDADMFQKKEVELFKSKIKNFIDSDGGACSPEIQARANKALFGLDHLNELSFELSGCFKEFENIIKKYLDFYFDAVNDHIDNWYKVLKQRGPLKPSTTADKAEVEQFRSRIKNEFLDSGRELTPQIRSELEKICLRLENQVELHFRIKWTFNNFESELDGYDESKCIYLLRKVLTYLS